MQLSRRLFLAGLSAAPLARAADTSSVEYKVYRAINFQRESAGLAALVWNGLLAETARQHSRRMVEARFFGHSDPVAGDLRTRLGVAGIRYLRAGENVFREKDYPDPVSLAVVEWMYSDGHRANILTAEYEQTGVGVNVADDGSVTMTQQFVRPWPARTR